MITIIIKSSQTIWYSASVLVFKPPAFGTRVGIDDDVYNGWFSSREGFRKSSFELLRSSHKITFPSESFDQGMVSCAGHKRSGCRVIFVRAADFLGPPPVTAVYTAIVENNHNHWQLVSDQCLQN